MTGQRRQDSGVQGAEAHVQTCDAKSTQSVSQTQQVAKGDRENDRSEWSPVRADEDAADEADFQTWLAMQNISQEGLVVPGSSL